jgi:DNA-binding CsgD family transcriptional regulator
MKGSIHELWRLKENTRGVPVPEQDNDMIIECARLLEQLYPDKVILLCREHHSLFKYAGGNSVDLWGYAKEAIESFTAENLIAMIHPEDVNSVRWGLLKLKELSEGMNSDFKTVFTYRMKTLGGHYITVQDEKVRVQTSKGTYAYFNIYSKLKDQKSPVKLEVYKKVSGQRMVRVSEFVFVDKLEPFSARELEVIKLLERGLDNMAIAQALSLSIYTVKNHKQKMFRKANVKNSLELIRFARGLNVI